VYDEAGESRRENLRDAKLGNDILAAALIGYQAELSKIDARVAELRAQLRGSPATNGTGQVARKRRGMSAAGKRRVAEAQRKRWAALKAAKAGTAKPKRKISAAGRAAIVKAVKARWAAVRAAAKKRDQKTMTGARA
jgi:hypothetical protein